MAVALRPIPIILRRRVCLAADAFDGEAGLLGGVVAGLQQLSILKAEWLATLQAAARTNAARPVVAIASGQVQSLCALWPYQCLEPLRGSIVSGSLRSAWWVLDTLRALRVGISAEPHAFLNINTPKDLADAEKRRHPHGT